MYRCSDRCSGHALADAVCGARRQVDVEADAALEREQRDVAGSATYKQRFCQCGRELDRWQAVCPWSPNCEEPIGKK